MWLSAYRKAWSEITARCGHEPAVKLGSKLATRGDSGSATRHSPVLAVRHGSEFAVRHSHKLVTRRGSTTTVRRNSEPVSKHGSKPTARRSYELPQGSALQPKLRIYLNQLRRLIAGAVLAFGCYQGLFLRRQSPLRVLAPCRISAFRNVDRAFLRAYFSMAKFHSKITKKSLSGHVFFFEDWRDRRVLTTFRTAMRSLV